MPTTPRTLVVAPTTRENTADPEEVITDILFREQTVECNPWVEYSSRAVQTLLPPILFFRFVDWVWLLGWGILWFGAMSWRIGMAGLYRRHYPAPNLPFNTRLWKLNRNAYQAYGWFVVGTVSLFCFIPGSVEWEIAAVAGICIVFALAPAYSHESSEIVVSAIALPLPLIAMLIHRGTPLHLSLAALTVGMIASLAIWGVQQVKIRRNEVRLRLALQQEKLRAEQANLAKSRFLAAASHDLRQPMHALALFVEALRSQVQHPPVRSLVDNIESSVRALDGLFNALLDISKLDAGTVTPALQHFSLRPLMERLDNEFRQQAHGRSLSWQCGGCDYTAHSDPVLFETILRNLISNAIRYTPRGSVHITCQPDRDLIRISVVDTGVGILPEHQAEVFREFHQLHNPERDRNKGLGLGLAIVDRLTRLLGIRLRLESAPGVGSDFSLEIPAGTTAVAEPATGSAQPVFGLFNGAVVLIIDDELDIRQGMKILLTNWGCMTLEAESGDEALRLLRELALVPELIVADLRLRHNQTGIDAIREVRATFGDDIPAMIVTGDTAPERLQEADAAGFPLLHKPVKPHRLRAAMLRLLQAGGDTGPALH